PSRDESAADLDAVVKGRRAVAAFADLPAEDGAVEIGRLLDVGRRDLEVADLSVGVRDRHPVPPGYRAAPGREYLVVTRQTVFPSETPSETSVKELGVISAKESR